MILKDSLKDEDATKNKKKHAGAELGQAQVKLEVKFK